ncbi:Thrombospondin type-1 (TSP1) repeat [Babesia duncani]|uniref:Thrombospondin type-1 (TSP1) repeat n=1 Tax=Babesia duncani TaxID=323732 RepID=A0AAD9UMW5_9APIC|nr:Thrombospondin type-1 (TSP1) repeat [Babesia duncani]
MLLDNMYKIAITLKPVHTNAKLDEPLTTDKLPVQLTPSQNLKNATGGMGNEAILSCPDGNVITIVNASIKCGKNSMDITNDAWKKCDQMSKCTLDPHDWGNCKIKTQTINVFYSCTKIYGQDCALFSPFKNDYAFFCRSSCMSFRKSCMNPEDNENKTDVLRCIWKLIKRNNLEHKCLFLLDGINQDQNNISWSSYTMEKFQLGTATVETSKWTRITFPKYIKDPIVFFTILDDYGYYATVLLRQVTNIGFNARLIIIICKKGHCAEDTKSHSTTIEWMAITVGEHSGDESMAIYAGLISTTGDSILKLPLNPHKKWSVITHIQETSLVKVDIASNSLGVPFVMHMVTETPEKIQVSFTYSIHKTPIAPNIKLGYVALEHGINPMKLYDTEFNTFKLEISKTKMKTINMVLGEKWPNSTKPFGSPQYIGSIAVVGLASNISGTLIAQNSYRMVNTSIEFVWNVQLHELIVSSISENITISGFVIENNEMISIRRICSYAKKITGDKRNRFCYNECIGDSGIKRCIGAENVTKCYHDRNSNCELIGDGILQDLITAYQNVIANGANKTNILNENGKTSVPSLPKSLNMPQIPRDSGSASDINNIPLNKVPIANGKNYELGEIVYSPQILNMECITGPWGQWSSCNHHCTSTLNDSNRVRKRMIYASNVGINSKPCITEEYEICKDLPSCGKLCVILQEDTGMEKNEYFIKWSKGCDIVIIQAANKSPIIKKVNQQIRASSLQLGSQVSYSKNSLLSIAKSRILFVHNTAHPLSNMLYSKKRSTNPEIQTITEGCNDSQNWSTCDAPCKDEDKPQQHLLIPIQCNDTRKDCVVDLKPCPNQPKPQQARCVLTNSIYEYKSKEWVKHGACICSRGIPCSASEIYKRKGYYELLHFENNAKIHNNIKIQNVQAFVSLANKERINIPSGFLKEITYGTFQEEELVNYCATGSKNYDAYDDDILWINCELASPKIRSDDDCIRKCKNIRDVCISDVPKSNIQAYVQCLNKKIMGNADSIDVIGFRHYKCKAPTLDFKNITKDPCDKLANIPYFQVSCAQYCNNILYECRNEAEHIREKNIRICMQNAIRSNRPQKNGTSVDFESSCTFKKTTLHGSGLVFCKEEVIDCAHEEWGAWSQCTGECIHFTKTVTEIPSRTRHRALQVDESIREYCEANFKTVDIERCIWLPQCISDAGTSISIKKHIAWEVEVRRKPDLQGWVMEYSKSTNERNKHIDKDNNIATPVKNCTIYRGHRNITNRKFVLQVCLKL